MDEDADVASVLGLRQQIVDHWPEGERKDAVLKVVDALLRSQGETSGSGAPRDADRGIPLG